MRRLFKQYGSFPLKIVMALLLILLALLWPIIIISLLIITIGSYILVDGILSLFFAIRQRKSERNWDWLFLNGMFGVFAGVLTFFNPFVIVAALIFMIVAK